MDRHTLLGQSKIGPLIAKFSIPAIAGMAVNALYNVIDRIFVGRGVGMEALSGIAVAMPFMIVLMAFAVLISVGTAVRLSISLGAKKIDEAEKIVGNAFVVSIISSLFLTVIGFLFLKPILVVFGGSGDALRYAEDFMRIVLLATVFQSIGYTLNGAIRAEGNPMMALATMVIGAIINTALNPFFIFVCGLGVRGSALATLVSQIVTAGWTFMYFLRKKNLIRLKARNFKPMPEVLGRIVAIGIGPFILQISMSAMLLVVNQVFSGFGGQDALAVIGIITVFSMLFGMIISGLSQGIQPIIGYNHGAGNPARVKRTIELSILIGTAICVAGFVPIFFWSREVMSLFSSDNPYIRDVGSLTLKYAFLTLPLLGFQIIGITYYQAVGKFIHALAYYLLKQVLLIIPLLLILPHFFGFFGGVAAFPITDIIMTVITGVLLASDWRKMGTAAARTAAENAASTVSTQEG
jgi:putative MATE family efflux protein